MSDSPRVPPPHLRQAYAALEAAGIPLAAGQQALDLATACYHATPQISQTDALRRERNQTQDELETVSLHLQQERAKTRRLEQELAAALALPTHHRRKAYQLRKRLRAMLAVLAHPQAKDATKLTRLRHLVEAALAGQDEEAGNLA